MVSEPGTDPGGPGRRWRRGKRRHPVLQSPSVAIVLAMLGVLVIWEAMVAVQCRMDAVEVDRQASSQEAVLGQRVGEWRL